MIHRTIADSPAGNRRALDPITGMLLRRASALFIDDRVMPRPPARAKVTVKGPHPDRILLVGGGPAVGWGVAIHELGLAGFLARWLTATTSRGAEVTVLADRGITVRTARDAVWDVNLEPFDYVVVTLGVEDAMNGISPARWRSQLTALLTQLRSTCAAHTPIIVAGIQPVRTIPIYDFRLASLADQRARALDEQTAAACASVSGVTFVPMDSIPAVRSARRTKKEFARAALLLVDAIRERSLRAEPEGRTAGESAPSYAQ